MRKHKSNSLEEMCKFLFMLVQTYITTQCHCPQDPIHNNGRRVNPKLLSVREV